MAASTLLCIHRDPTQFGLLKENGYDLLTATNGHDGLRLFRSQAVDAIVVEYNLGALDGAVIAAEIRQVRPKVPIVMVADDLDLPDGALRSVDALVTKADGPHFLWAAVHFVLSGKAARLDPEVNVRGRREPRFGEIRRQRIAERLETRAPPRGDEENPFSAELWEGVLGGNIRF